MTHSKSQSLRWLFLTGLLFCVFSSALQAKDNKFTPEMIVNLKRVTQVAIDPSGQKIAFVLNVPRAEKDEHGKSYSEIWLTTVDGEKPKQYTSKPGRPSSVSWSPDGKWITFLSKREDQDEHTQIYKMRVDGGEAVALTHHKNSISRYQWSPDGKSIAYITNRRRNSDIYLVDLKSGNSRPLTKSPANDLTPTASSDLPPDTKAVTAPSSTSMAPSDGWPKAIHSLRAGRLDS